MKVFIAWSGETSQKVASILKSWLPTMNPRMEASVSFDTTPGESWMVSLSHALSACDCALFCVTKDNVGAPWLYYEAGVVVGCGKSVIPVLFDTSAHFFGPLDSFQSFPLDKDGMRELACALNASCGDDAVSPEELDATFEGVYPTIEKMLAEARKEREEREREEYEQEKREWGKRPRAGGENPRQEFETLNGKLDAILSQLSMFSPGNVHGRAE